MGSNMPSDDDSLVNNEGSDRSPLEQMEMVTYLLEKALEALGISREREVFLQNSLNALMSSEDFNLNQKWLELKDKFSKTVKQNQRLLKLIQLVVEDAKEKQGILKEDCRREMEGLKAELQSIEINYKAKEAELQHKLELARSFAAVQSDETDSNLKRQLVDVNSKARNQQNEIRYLQQEIQNLRTRLSSKQSFPDPRNNNVLIFNPTMNPQPSNPVASAYQEKLQEQVVSHEGLELNRPGSNGPKWSYSSIPSTVSLGHKAETNEGDGSNLKTGDGLVQDQEVQKPVPFRKSSPDKFSRLNIFDVPSGKTPMAPRKRRNPLPPLIPCTVSTANNVGEGPVKRKRVKLYNPDDYDDL